MRKSLTRDHGVRAAVHRGALEHVECHFSHQSEVFSAVALAHASVVFAEGHVEDPVQLVLHFPVPTDKFADALSGRVETGDVAPAFNAGRPLCRALGFNEYEATKVFPLACSREPVSVVEYPGPTSFQSPQGRSILILSDSSA